MTKHCSAGHRARSTSRRRPYDDGENGERSAGPLYQSFPSPSSARNGSSPHSSPGSVNLPSPAMTVVEQTPQQVSQQMPPPQTVTDTSSGLANAYNYQSPISPTQPSPPRNHYDYSNYGVQPSSLSQDTTQQWTAGGSDYASTSQDQNLYSNPFGYGSLDGGFGGYDPTADLTSGLSTTPPSSHFAASGLPFRGLDYIRNFNPGAYPSDSDPSLWQSYDLGPFAYDPDLAFTLGDPSTLTQDNVR